MYCGFCGEPMLDTAKYCPKCGGLVSKMAQTAIEEEDDNNYGLDEYAPEAAVKTHHPGRIILVVVLILGIAAAAVFLGLKLTGSGSSDEEIQGQSSLTSLVNSYLQAAGDNDLDSLTALYFPGSEKQYESSEDELTAAELLAEEDAWAVNYGKPAEQYVIGSSDFADLTSSKASTVAEYIKGRSGVKEISELFTVPVDVTYQDGTAVQMIFEVVQTDLGTFLVEVD